MLHSYTMSSKAKRKPIYLGNIELSVFQLPDGSYLLSQMEVATVVNVNESIFRSFLGSNNPEALPYKGLIFARVMEAGQRGR